MAGFTFGATNSPAPATGTSFSIGTPSSSNTTSGPSTGFAFGSAIPTVSAPSPAPNAATPSSPFSFGGAASQPAGNTSIPLPSTTTSSTSTISQTTKESSNLMKVPQFEMSFPNLAIDSKLEKVLKAIQDPATPDTALTYLGEELEYMLSSQNAIGKLLSNPNPLGDYVAANAALRSNLMTVMKVQLPSKEAPTPLTNSMLKNIFEISDALHIKEEDAAILYNSVILDSLDEETLGKDTVEWFEKIHKRPSSLDDVVQISISNAQDDGTYISRVGKSADITMGDQEEDVILSAVNLFFNERAQILKTLLMLIQLRVSICTSFDATQELSVIDSIILKSTDKLLNQNVIRSLIQTAKILTLQNDEVAEKICAALDKDESLSSSSSASGFSISRNHAQLGAPGISSDFTPSHFNTGSARPFHSSASIRLPSGGQTTAFDAPHLRIHEADYCLYNFTIEQRFLVCQCLFYLAYHTQLEIEEITDMIDLLRDLTNGESMGGIGGGLQILDPIRDVPDPYTLSWKEAPNTQKQGTQVPISMTPQQTRYEKNEGEWKQELIKSLWSVRGLTKATISTSTEYQGHEMFRMSTFKEHNSSIEGVGHGKPQLMRCTSLLLLSVLCALNANSILFNRVSHGPNSFVGNSFVSPDSSSGVLQTLLPIRQRIDPDMNGISNWRRQDIEGLISAAFGLLLRPLTETLSSPKSGDSGIGQINSTFKACLEHPSICKSFTFVRVSLIPCLGFSSRVPASLNQESDFLFLISVLSNFTSSYVDTICSFSQLPDSRAKWMNVEVQELELSYVREQQRKQMSSWSGQEHKDVTLPNEVDESKRPDCLDDIIALIVMLCQSDTVCSNVFWVHTDSKGLEPSRIMKKLEASTLNDASLIPSYMSLLSALSLADAPDPNSSNPSGAQLVYEWLCKNSRLSSSSTYDSSKQFHWESILIYLRYYANNLNPTDDNMELGPKSGEKYDLIYNEDSSSYYYGVDDAISSTVNTSTDSNPVLFSSQAPRRELREIDWKTLESMIHLISNISAKSPSCRRRLLRIRIPDTRSKTFSTVEDDILSILFSILVSPVSSELRGLVFTATSNLIRRHDLSDLTIKEEDEADDTIVRCWEMLEACQIIPVVKFSQYNSLLHGLSNNSDPPDKMKWLPMDEHNGILYEMEYVESVKGNYPATEGVLKLLTSLFLSQIHPINLGEQFRQQPGCTPYLEYVVDFVLPRVIGVESSSQELYFSSSACKFRLLARALEVLDAVLSTYFPFYCEPSNHQAPKHSITVGDPEMSDYGPLHEIQDHIVPRQVSRDVESESASDFTDEAIPGSVRKPSEIQGMGHMTQNSVPRRKSAGFSLLADIISANGRLLETIVKILSESEHRYLDERIDASLCSMSLYGEAYPSFHCSRDARNYLLLNQKVPVSDIGIGHLSSKYLKLFLRPLIPDSTEFSSQVPLSNTSVRVASPYDAVLWKDTCILHSIRLLCGAAARYPCFCSSIARSQSCTRYVPVLSFHRKRVIAGSPLTVKTLQVINLSKVLSESFISISSGSRQSLIQMLSAVVAYQSYGLSRSNILSVYAIALLRYIFTNASPFTIVHHDNSHPFCNRLALITTLYRDEGEYQISHGILNIVYESVITQGLKESIGYGILGLSKTINDYRDYLRKSSEGLPCELCDHQNALDIMIHFVSETGFILNSITAPLASKSFEILYFLCAKDTDDTESERFYMRVCVMEKLRKSDFWRKRLYQYLVPSFDSHSLLSRILCQVENRYPDWTDKDSIENIDHHILLCISWLLKGISLELHALLGVDPTFFHEKFSATSPQPLKSDQLLSLLIGKKGRILLDSFKLLCSHAPTTSQDLLTSLPLRELLRLSSGSTFELPYVEKCIDELNSDMNPKDKKDLVATTMLWRQRWNTHTSFLSAVAEMTRSWSELTSTIFSSCDEILLSSLLCEEDLASNLRSAMDIVILSLKCFNFRIFTAINDSKVLASLAHVVLHAIDTTFKSEMISRLVHHDQLGEVICVCIEAIVNYAENQKVIDTKKKEIVVVLAGALSVILNSDLICRTSSSIILIDERFRSLCLHAAGILANLSLPQHKKSDEDTCSDSLERLARSALISLLLFFESQDSFGNNSNFASDIFTHTPNNDILQKLMCLLAKGDNDIPHLLQTILCCSGGANLLVENGAVSSMLSASTSFLEHMSSVVHPVSMKMHYPAFLYTHLSLLTALIHSKIPQYSLHQFLREVCRFVEIHDSTISSLISSYPSNHDLTILFMQLLVSLWIRACDTANVSILSGISSISKLDDRIAMLINQLSQFPYPPDYLPLLPHQLRESQTRRLRRNRFQNDYGEYDRCWWDSVPETNGFDDIPVRKPPTGSIDASDICCMSKLPCWTLRKYYTSYSAMKCVQLGYFYFSERARDVEVSMSIDILSLCLSLSRMCDIARAIESRITSFQYMEDDMRSTIDPLRGLQSNHYESLIAIQSEEQDILHRSGVLVASSILIVLDLLKVSLDISRKNIAVMGMGDVKEDAKNISCALQYCMIDTTGIGCTRFLIDSSKIDADTRMVATTLLTSAKQLLEI